MFFLKKSKFDNFRNLIKKAKDDIFITQSNSFLRNSVKHLYNPKKALGSHESRAFCI